MTTLNWLACLLLLLLIRVHMVSQSALSPFGPECSALYRHARSPHPKQLLQAARHNAIHKLQASECAMQASASATGPEAFRLPLLNSLALSSFNVVLPPSTARCIYQRKEAICIHSGRTATWPGVAVPADKSGAIPASRSFTSTVQSLAQLLPQGPAVGDLARRSSPAGR